MEYSVVSKQCWERFLGGDLPDSNDTSIPMEIVESWHLCRDENVNPYDGKARKVLDLNALREKKKQNKKLIELAKPHISQLRNFLKGWRCLINLTDSNGYILLEFGDKTLLNAARKLNFREGANWGEKEVGTNAIGLALRLKKPITVKGYEHFSVASQPWNCSSAPIFDQHDNLIGALNISSLSGDINDDYVLASVKLTASHISLEWKYKMHQDLKVLTTGFTSEKQVIVCSLNEVIYSFPRELYPQYHKYIGSPLSELIKEGTLQFSNNRIPIKMEERMIGYKIPIEKTDHHSKINFKGVQGTSDNFQNVIELVKQVSIKDTPVHIYGETGTGKELIAEAIHDNSNRSQGPLMKINCGALPAGLLESELFGYEPGAFTGANNKGYKGKLEQANNGTLFLDEIDEMSPTMQVSLLRALQQKEIMRIGGSNVTSLNIRIVTACNKDLRKLVKENKFREDLFYRIYVFPIQLPPLREREEDIKYFIEDFFQRQKWFPNWYHRLETVFLQGEWHGNVRELYNALERCEILYSDKTPSDEDLLQLVSVLEPMKMPESCHSQSSENCDFKAQLELNKIKETLAKYNGKVASAAEELNISKATLYRKLKKHNLSSK